MNRDSSLAMTLDNIIVGITPADPKARHAAELRQACLTKPPGSLGRLEDLSIQLQAYSVPIVRLCKARQSS